MTAEKLNTAIQLVQSGRGQAAVPVLREIIQENPADENAWLWLAECMDDVEHKRFCLQRVLTINPHNLQAQMDLTSLNEGGLVPQERPMPGEPLREKMEWELDEAEEEPARPVEVPRIELDWDEEDEVAPVQPASPKPAPPKRKLVRVAAGYIPPRRKPRGGVSSLLPGLGFLAMFFMLGIVCLVFLQALADLLIGPP